jgi:hypothetical protein
MLAKLCALVIVAVLSPDNCLFRKFDRNVVAIVRQALLLGATVVFFAVQCVLGPFLGPVGNASEFSSRLSYVLTAVLSLLVALNVPGQDAFNGIVLYVYVLDIIYSIGSLTGSRVRVYAVTYSLSFCRCATTADLILMINVLADFTIIDTGLMQRAVKRMWMHIQCPLPADFQ